MLQSTFSISKSNWNNLTKIEQEADYYYQILLQCEGDFRNLKQNVAEALISLGIDDYTLIIPHIDTLSSKFLFLRSPTVVDASIYTLNLLSQINPGLMDQISKKTLPQLRYLISKYENAPSENWLSIVRMSNSLANKLKQDLQGEKRFQIGKKIEADFPKNLLERYNGCWKSYDKKDNESMRQAALSMRDLIREIIKEQVPKDNEIKKEIDPDFDSKNAPKNGVSWTMRIKYIALDTNDDIKKNRLLANAKSIRINYNNLSKAHSSNIPYNGLIGYINTSLELLEDMV